MEPGAIDPRTHRALAGASRVRVLEHLRAHTAAMTAAEIANGVGLHPNTVRLHLDQLADAGLVTRDVEARTTPGRPRALFAAVVPEARPADGEDDGYRALAGVLAAQLERSSPRAAEDAARAGRAWGRTLTERRDVPDPAAATGHLVRLMDRLGFAPSASGSSIQLHRCPFRQVAEEHSAVVCGVHLGLMQGALDNLGAPLRADRLEPFRTPDLCLAHLAPVPDTPVPDTSLPDDTEGLLP